MAKQVAIIGAGCTGLGAIKCCLDEDLVPTCFESSSDIGGLWRFTDDVTDERGCVMNSTVINTSKEMMSFSDFPAPKEFPNFLHHSKVVEYFRLYAKKFKLQQYIHFNKEVISISQHRGTHPDETSTGNVPFLDKTDPKSKSSSDLFAAKHGSMYCNNLTSYSNNKSVTQTYTDCLSKSSSRYENIQDGTGTITSLITQSQIYNNGKSRNEDTSLQTSGQWEIKVKEKITGTITTHHFDFVLICTGHHADTYMPYFPGQSLFKGRIIHSRDLRRANGIAGSRHVVVGIGNSGCDAAVELSRCGQVYLSTRRGTWLMQRLQKHGLPADIVYMSRFVFATALKLPTWLLNTITEFHLNRVVDHSLYGLRPNHGPFATHPTVNDEIPNRIASGHVIIKPNIASFTESGVRFEDGTFVDDIDTVVMATGYRIGFPFLDQSTLAIRDNHCPLYMYMFPPTITPPTLAVIGCIQAGGAVMPVSEMQCRMATRVFKNEVKLPSQREMLLDIEARKKVLEKRYVHTQRHTIQVDFLPYMDELASKVGCKPKLGSLFIKDPYLAITCIFGPCTAYQYRLMGPGAWPGARDAIMKQMDRVRYPFCTRTTQGEPRTVPAADMATSVKIFLGCLCFLGAILFVNSVLSAVLMV